MRTRPLSIKYMASPASPARKSVVSALTFWVRSSLRNSTAASSSSEANNGTDRIASSVISCGVGVDMEYLGVPQLVKLRARASYQLALHNPAVFHHDDAVRVAAGQFVIVRHQKDGQSIFVDHLAQQRQQLAGARRI